MEREAAAGGPQLVTGRAEVLLQGFPAVGLGEPRPKQSAEAGDETFIRFPRPFPGCAAPVQLAANRVSKKLADREVTLSRLVHEAGKCRVADLEGNPLHSRSVR